MKIFSLFIFLTIIFSGCRYKEGPMISFRSVEKRLLGTWQIVEFTSDGVDSLKYYNDSLGSNMVMVDVNSERDKDYRIFFDYHKADQFGASFAFSDNKNIIIVDFFYYQKRIIGPIGYGTSKWEILKLSNKKLTFSTDFNGRNYIFSFKKL